MVLPVIVVHGGAGVHAAQVKDKAAYDQKAHGVRDAAVIGYRMLAAGGSAVDAVEAAVISLEDHPAFNAGKGSYYTSTGDIEMDASIMDGKTLRGGAVGCIQNFANPISVAKLVMQSDHVLMVGEGAAEFAKSKGMKSVPTDALRTAKADKRLRDCPHFTPSSIVELSDVPQTGTSEGTDATHDTVGAVAVDLEGNVAHAISSGGKNAKMPGRCATGAIIGAGGYSDNRSGAVAVTGDGEAFFKVCFGKEVTQLLEQGTSPQEAVEKCLASMEERVHGSGGAIALNTRGDVGVNFRTQGMSWCYVKDGEIHYGILKGDDTVEPLPKV